MFVMLFFFFKQKTAYEMRISDWSSDVCSSDLGRYGTASNGMLACCGVRLLLRRLQARQALTTFSHSSLPCLEIGSTWSRVSSARLKCSPQYRQIGRASCRERVCQYV